MEIIKINSQNRALITDFLNLAGKKTLEKFRYFNSRSLDVVDNHAATFVLRYRERTVAYGHLDKEDKTIWLGIAVAESFHGLGLGKLMMTHLMSYARLEKMTKIKLAVDLDNTAAIPLYQKFGFQKTSQTEKFYFMESTVNK